MEEIICQLCGEDVYADMLGRHMAKDHLIDDEGCFSPLKVLPQGDMSAFDTIVDVVPGMVDPAVGPDAVIDEMSFGVAARIGLMRIDTYVKRAIEMRHQLNPIAYK